MAKFINVITPVREEQVEISVNVNYIRKVVPDNDGSTSWIYVIKGGGDEAIHVLESYSGLVNRLAG